MTGYALRDTLPQRRLAARHRCTPLLARTSLACAISTLFLAPALAQETSNGQPPFMQTMAPVAVTEQALAEPGTATTVSGDALDRANNMKDVVRNQPLVSAPGTAAGTTRNRSSFDRSGTTG